MENNEVIDYDFARHRALDLLEQIRRVNEMIDLHQSRPDGEGNFMANQYKGMRQQFLDELQEVLVLFKVQVSIPQAA
ncbi:MAG: hypothetical protein AAFO82_02870 [Bacteroidota bacterium]